MNKCNIELKQKIIMYAKEIGIDKIGFTTAEPFYELEQHLFRHRELGYESGLEEKDLKKRIDPKLSLKSAESIISIAIAYPSKQDDTILAKEGLRGIVSCSAWGLDYHIVLRDKLSKLCDFITEQNPKAEFVCMADMGPLSDRAVAERAGLGWIGKNSLLITQEYGSYVFLGEIITNIKISEDKLINEECGECTICIDACPNSAIVKPRLINSQKCLSYLTQKKDNIADQFLGKLENRLYGCDTCQEVCPKNIGINSTHHKQFTPNPELSEPLLKILLSISKKDFNNKWGLTAAGWRGKTTIQRNAIICLANLNDKSAIVALRDLLINDNRENIRYISAWALGNIGGEEAKEALYVSKKVEKSSIILEITEKSLEKLLG